MLNFIFGCVVGLLGGIFFPKQIKEKSAALWILIKNFFQKTRTDE